MEANFLYCACEENFDGVSGAKVEGDKQEGGIEMKFWALKGNR